MANHETVTRMVIERRSIIKLNDNHKLSEGDLLMLAVHESDV